MRGIFFREDDARAAVRRLRADGYEATASVDRLAGEDDDEDHPWAVVADAPREALELLVEQYDGWLDTDEDAREHNARPTATPAPAPLDLPSAPRRLHREP